MNIYDTPNLLSFSPSPFPSFLRAFSLPRFREVIRTVSYQVDDLSAIYAAFCRDLHIKG